jgi:hypothetical protein
VHVRLTNSKTGVDGRWRVGSKVGILLSSEVNRDSIGGVSGLLLGSFACIKDITSSIGDYQIQVAVPFAIVAYPAVALGWAKELVPMSVGLPRGQPRPKSHLCIP